MIKGYLPSPEPLVFLQGFPYRTALRASATLALALRLCATCPTPRNFRNFSQSKEQHLPPLFGKQNSFAAHFLLVEPKTHPTKYTSRSRTRARVPLRRAGRGPLVAGADHPSKPGAHKCTGEELRDDSHRQRRQFSAHKGKCRGLGVKGCLFRIRIYVALFQFRNEAPT